jgi:hypothetical protein
VSDGVSLAVIFVNREAEVVRHEEDVARHRESVGNELKGCHEALDTPINKDCVATDLFQAAFRAALLKTIVCI